MLCKERKTRPIKEGTAACVIEWKKSRALTRPPVLRCTDDGLDELIKLAEVVGIDAPFGWPTTLVEQITNWTITDWLKLPKLERERLRFRVTDLSVLDELKLWPLSVSTDRIALKAIRANALLTRHGVKDRSGGPKFYEVYPAASLKSWGITCRGYKLIDPKCRRVRASIFEALQQKFPELELGDEYVESSDALDALVASLTVRAAALGLTTKPGPELIPAAMREGWIHFSEE